MTWHHLANRIPWSASHKRDPPSLLSQGGVNHSEKCKVDKDKRNPKSSLWAAILLQLLLSSRVCQWILQFWISNLFFESVFFFDKTSLLGYTSKLQKRYAQAYINPGSVSLYPSMLQKNESWHIHRRSTRPGVESRMNNKRCAKKRGLHKHVTAWPFCWWPFRVGNWAPNKPCCFPLEYL